MTENQNTPPTTKTQNKENKKESYIDSLTTSNISLIGFTIGELDKKGVPREKADEVIQKAHVQAQTKIRNGGKIYNPPGYFRTIIPGIISKEKTEWKKKHSKNIPLLEDHDKPDLKHSNSPEKYIKSIEILDFIKQHLSKKEYFILIYHYVHYWCYKQIANELNKLGFRNKKGKLYNAAAIRKSADRAKKKVRKPLAEKFDFKQ